MKITNHKIDLHKSKSAYIGFIFYVLFCAVPFFTLEKIDFLIVFRFLLPLPIHFLLDYFSFEIQNQKLFTWGPFSSGREMNIDEVKLINILNGYGYFPFRPYNLEILGVDEKKAIRPMFAFFRNGHELTEILIDKVYEVNPDVRIDPVLLKKYGFRI
jgi:hypothetical protein